MIKSLTTQEFKEKIFDFEKDKKFKYNGTIPCILTCSASWCAPCKQLTPILDQISEEYDGKVDVYKIDVDEEHQLSSLFNIRSVPTMLFVPVNGEITTKVGALPKGNIIKLINEMFF